MALSEPRSFATVDVQLTGSALRLRALELAVQRYEGTSSKGDKLVEFAQTLEEYLAGRPRDASHVDARPVAAGSPWNPDPEDEKWRMSVEREPYDGVLKADLPPSKLAYRVEVLAQIILVDVNEDPATRRQALLELVATTKYLEATYGDTDGAE